MADGPMSAAPGGTPKGGGSAGVIIGVILLLGAAGAILFYVNRKDTTPQTIPSAQPSAPASTTAAPETTLDLPPIDLPKDAGVEDTGPKTASTGGGGGNACSCGQSGSITDEIKQAAAARGGTAKKCYQSALEGNEGLAGDMTVLVRIGPNGEACSASIVSDTTGSSKLQQCVRLKMAAGGYPRPKGGCVDVKVPVVFKPKT